MQAGDFATWAGVAVTLLISVCAWTDSRRNARIGQEANEISHMQAEAAERRASVVEDALAAALRVLGERAPGLSLELPESWVGRRGEVRWEVRRCGRHRFVLRNVGSDTAFGVRIDPDGLGVSARNLPQDATVRPDGSVQFVMAAGFGRRLPDEVCVRWGGGGQAGLRAQAVTVSVE
ncbi:hypothetical protein ACIRPT_09165 [Streptomyces sp. NPDC101227]|uniref:hypothetical protein n=1 Tax=Streptomyces sp. NPDC101227 TaxID=3366136 RepID=UPI00380C7365